uniref:Ig-like domain-containing protein n=1 Tax=Syphacia muris TaxID=451379 RepID=A0A158R5C5_9BILA
CFNITWQFFYYVGEWGPCSATCGRGIETRPVECVYIQAYTAKRVPLPEYECRVKQNSYRECYAKPCFESTSSRFKWDYGEWSQCSASCLGGKQHSKLKCVDVTRNIAVGWSFCDPRQRPVDVRQCNTQPCPPVWEVQNWFPCSVTCGEGVKTRAVTCVQEKADGQVIELNSTDFCLTEKPANYKVECPVRKFPRNKIRWFKDGQLIINRVRVSPHGRLRIFNSTEADAGTYTCAAKKLIDGNTTLKFKPSTRRKSAKVIITFVFVNSTVSRFDWTTCSQVKCGTPGLQVLFSDEYVATVSDYICKSFGLNKPPTQKRCRASNCPTWKASAWSEVSIVSVQKRTVKCVDNNGTEVSAALCDKKTRPKQKMRCFNANCIAKWLPSDWGSCTRTCGDGGVQLRILHCVWSATGKPAKNCNSAEQPKVVRKCVSDQKLPQCFHGSPFKGSAMLSNDDCVDKFRYCDIIKIFRRSVVLPNLLPPGYN